MGIIGYARVSTTGQNLDMQITALQEAGASRIFAEKGVSGSKASRPELDKMLDHLRAEDEVIVYRLDRIARNTRHLLDLVDTLTDKGVTFRSLTEGISTSGAMGRAMLTIMGALAQLEREQTIERIHDGLEEARSRGNIGGRPKALDPATTAKARELKDKGLSVADICRHLNVSRSTLYKYLGQAS